MSSLAQEESRSISENVKWGIRKKFADGKVKLNFTHFLGYDKGANDNLVINEEQAIIVRKIYRLFLDGFTPHAIAKQLTEEQIPTPAGKETWSRTTILRVLQNEKYIGSALLQKTYVDDFLTKKQKKNTGEVQQYLVEDNHEPIITKEVFELVKIELEKRQNIKGKYSGVDMFASKVICGECGHLYGAKVWHSNSKYKKTIYQCNHKFKNEKNCETKHFSQDEIKGIFIKAVNELLTNKDEIVKNLKFIKSKLCDNETFEKQKEQVNDEMIVLVDLIQNLITENARTKQDQTAYQDRYNSLVLKYESLKEKATSLESKLADNLSRNEILGNFIKVLKKQNGAITEFDDSLWGSLLENIVVYKDNRVEVLFKDGTKLEGFT